MPAPTHAREPSRGREVVLLSCYELGHAPHGLALPAAFLRAAGFRPRVIDLACDSLDDAVLADAAFVGISVPMHTALRLGVAAARRVRAARPDCHICFYGLYAPLNAGYLRDAGADSVLGGEHEARLVALVRQVIGGEPTSAGADIALERLVFPVPRRDELPALRRYAQLAVGDQRHLAGYAETTRGCKHMCRHCPIPPVYGGRFFAVPIDTVLSDVAQQVAAGARHISFGDPDFFNGPSHGVRVALALHERWPALSFDVTIKVSHLLAHPEHLPALAEAGCAFVISAVESVDDAVLARLDKGHTRADVAVAAQLCRKAGLVLRPTFVPFTPWTTLEGLVDLMSFLVEHELADAVDPVQLSIRLLVPPGSLLLAPPTRDAFGALDPAALTHRWEHANPAVDALQRAIAARCEQAADADEPPASTFAAIRDLVYAAAELRPPPLPERPARAPVPRMTESWFCCSEPTARQLDGI